ncbi:glycosyltransferase [Bacillota bacterium HCP3S3_E9]
MNNKKGKGDLSSRIITQEVMQNEIIVSILCATYNQVSYIRSALEGFIHQETEFAYEVIVHDDASTDGTTNIVKEYAEKYPEIIRPLYEEENQYSKGNNIYQLMYSVMRGQYIAICEGDDYWCDIHKLQKQVDIMERYQNVVACVHNAWKLDCIYNRKTKFSKREENGVISVEDIIHWDDKGYATASLLLKKEWLFIPQEFQMKDVGDYPQAIYMALHGEIYYIGECMSVYRCNAEGSWTNNMAHNMQKFRFYIKDMNRMLRYIDDYSDGKYHSVISDKIYTNSYWLVYKEIYSGSQRGEYADSWKILTKFDRKKVLMTAHLRPFIDQCSLCKKKLLNRVYRVKG